ncbi:hypothetical protein CGZ65_04005 [Neisseria weixii]|nr:hypothetical protein CGZ65_04005 [Neisseria weixii]
MQKKRRRIRPCYPDNRIQHDGRPKHQAVDWVRAGRIRAADFMHQAGLVKTADNVSLTATVKEKAQNCKIICYARATSLRGWNKTSRLKPFRWLVCDEEV